MSTLMPAKKSREGSAGSGATLSKNVALSLARVAVNSLVALILPAYLTHHLPVATYSAWVLILQLGTFVAYLDFGIQTGVAKFVAEYCARNDVAGAGRFASAGLILMICAGLLGSVLTLVLAWQVPRLFHTMPVSLYHDVRMSVILVGLSLSFGLVCSVFSAIFQGLQIYAIPMGIAIANRILFTAAVFIAVLFNTSLVKMAIAAALVNITTGLLQVVAWKKIASHIFVSLTSIDSSTLDQMFRYCSLLSVWIAGMICVSGLDLTLVGHYAYSETAYYSIAALPINFMILVISSILGPIMPATSALGTQRSPSEMGDFLVKATRYSSILLLLTGLPLIVFGIVILRLWVGPEYAVHTLPYLRILVAANIIRCLCAPYTTMVAGTGQLKAATAAPVCEALVNIGSSIYFAKHFGAIGVAFGTLLGALVNLLLHFVISMHYSRATLAISRYRLLVTGLFRPAIIVLPSCFFLFWPSGSQNTSVVVKLAAWGLCTLLLTYFGTLNRGERTRITLLVKAQRI